MKKLISLILCCLICGITSAQLIKQKVEKTKKNNPETGLVQLFFLTETVYMALKLTKPMNI